MENHSLTDAPIKFASILIKNIYIVPEKFKLFSEIQIGKSVIKKTFGLDFAKKIPSVFAINSPGFLFDYFDYKIFIVPQFNLPGYIELEKNSSSENVEKFDNGFWFVEQFREFNEFKIYFLKHGLQNSHELTYFKFTECKHFCEIYHTIPEIGINPDFFIKFKLANGIEYLVKIFNAQIKIQPINKEISIYVGVIKTKTIFSHLFLFATKDLIDLQNKGLGKNNLRFTFDGKRFNVPNLPIIDGDLRNEFKYYRQHNEYISRSMIISFSYSIDENTSAQDVIMERTDRIIFSDTYEIIKDYTEVFDLIALTNSVEEDAWDYIRELD